MQPYFLRSDQHNRLFNEQIERGDVHKVTLSPNKRGLFEVRDQQIRYMDQVVRNYACEASLRNLGLEQGHYTLKVVDGWHNEFEDE